MNLKYSVTRYHDISCGHRVVGHENKCRFLHGHNYRIHFTCEAEPDLGGLDSVGRVIDFSVIKTLLCDWLELNWDHKTLLWSEDPLLEALQKITRGGPARAAKGSFVSVIFNPTAENMADHLLRVIAPSMLVNTGVRVVSVCIEETRKCSASAHLE